MADEKWVGKIVKFKSGRYGIVLASQSVGDNIFLTVHVAGMGTINIRALDVEEVK